MDAKVRVRVMAGGVMAWRTIEEFSEMLALDHGNKLISGTRAVANRVAMQHGFSLDRGAGESGKNSRTGKFWARHDGVDGRGTSVAIWFDQA